MKTYLFEISRYTNISKQGPNTCYVALTWKGVRLISPSSQTRSGSPLFLRLMDSLVIGNILTKFEKDLSSEVFSGE